MKVGYIYNNQYFLIKQQAFDCALSRRDYTPNIRFIFYDDEYSVIDWSVEPETPLQELYISRARQLRETHDYLVVMYSGGADSTNMIETFLNAGIFIDEIKITFPLQVIEKINKTTDQNHPLGHFFEYDLAAMPTLKRIKLESPNTKINTCPDFLDFIKENCNEKFVSDNIDVMRITHGIIAELRYYHDLRYLSDLAEKQKGVVGVYALDKPKITIDPENELTFNFSDMGSLYGFQYQILGYTNYNIELFYWSEHSPLIPVKQMHLIKHALEKYPSFYKMAKLIIDHKETVRPIYEPIIHKIIYPKWDHRYQKIIRAQDDLILGLIFPAEKSVGAANLRKKPWVNSYIDDLLDQKNKELLQRYGKIKYPSRAHVAFNSTRDDWYEIKSRSVTRSYYIGKVNCEKST